MTNESSLGIQSSFSRSYFYVAGDFLQETFMYFFAMGHEADQNHTR